MRMIKQSIPFFILFLLMLLTVSPIQAFADTDEESHVSYVALGDSLAAGVLNTPDFERGKGYPEFIQEGIEMKTGSDVQLTNEGFPGFTSEDVLDQLTANEDNIMDALADADMITLDVGANDLLQAVDIENIDPTDPDSMQQAIEDATAAITQISTNMTAILDDIQSVNPDAPIYVMGYYNAKPYLEDMQDMVVMVMGIMNDTIESVADNGGASYVPTFAAFEGKYATYLPNPNNIHPTEAGYAVIADLFLEQIDPVDAVKPAITLNGDNPVELEVGEAYDEPGATAEDNVDGDLTDDIAITSVVNTDEAGEYVVTYAVSDAAGNERIVTRTVIVKEAEAEEPDEETGGLWFLGDDEPASEIVDEGDLYLNTTDFDVYKKDADGWEIIGNLKEYDGASLWTVGEGSPDAADGTEGDLYVDSASGNVYFKTTEGWHVVTNLEKSEESPVPEGPKGDDGEKGAQGDDGPAGDCECDTDNHTTESVDHSIASEKVEGTHMSNEEEGGKLPDTATNNPLIILIGSIMLIVGAVIVFIRRKVKKTMQVTTEVDG